jgi:hypothetical protein
MLVPADVAVQMATAILRMVGVKVDFINPGVTVIRANGNGSGK